MILGIHTNDLNLDIDLNKAFAKWVDLDETWINSTIESTELCNQTNITLRNGLVWIWADNTAGNGSHGTDT